MAKIATKTPGATGVTFLFSNGETVVADVAALPSDMILRLAIHGMSQKGGDSYASANDKGLTLAECAEGVRDIVANLANGIWSAAGGTGSSINAEALSRITSEDMDACVKAIDGMSEDARKELIKRPDMKAAIARIKAERAEARADDTAAVDSSDLNGLFNK